MSTSPQNDSPLATYADVLARLDAHGIAYMVVGSVAAIVYGEPRMTADMDVVVELLPQDARRFEAIFQPDDTARHGKSSRPRC